MHPILDEVPIQAAEEEDTDQRGTAVGQLFYRVENILYMASPPFKVGSPYILY